MAAIHEAFIFLFLKFTLIGEPTSAIPQLSEGPVSVSALVGENAQFHCSGSGFTIIWTVDEYSASESIIMARGITQSMVTSSDTIQSTLTVPAILENNGTTVQCVIYPGEVTSNNATLTVLPGIGPVVNVRFSPPFDTVLWDPPATAGVLSGLSYIVIVMNNNTGQVIISDATNNTIYPLPGAPTPCQYYTANVTAFSTEHHSESVIFTQRTTGDYYDLKSVSDAVVAFFNKTYCSVSFMIDIQKRNTLVQTCLDQELTSETYPKTNMTDRDSHKEVAITETGIQNYTTLVLIGHHYLNDIMIVDDNDLEIEMMTVPFSSFNIQDCNTSSNNTVMLVKCIFFINSTATGFAVIKDNQTHKTFNGTLKRVPDDSDRGSVNITDLPAGEYSVRVYDNVIDYVNDKEPAYEHFLTLHISPLPTAASRTISPSSATLLSEFFSVHASTYSVSSPSIIPDSKSSVTIVAVITPLIICGILLVMVVIIILIKMCTIARKRTCKYVTNEEMNNCTKNGLNTRHNTKNDLEKNMHDEQVNVDQSESEPRSFSSTASTAKEDSDLPPAADEVEPVYSAPHRPVAAEPTEDKNSLHYAEVDHSTTNAPVAPLPAELVPVEYAKINSRN